VNNTFAYSSGVEHPVFMGIRGEGTNTSPSYPLSGKVLSSFIGRDALDYGAVNFGGASVYMVATENFSFTNKGTRLRFNTTNNGSNIETERMSVEPNGDIFVDGSKPIFIQKFSCTCDFPDRSTGVSSALYSAVIAGVWPVNNTSVDARSVQFMMYDNGGIWYFKGDLQEPLNETWYVDVMFIKKQLVNDLRLPGQPNSGGTGF
jgi:hypothetical protein